MSISKIALASALAVSMQNSGLPAGSPLKFSFGQGFFVNQCPHSNHRAHDRDGRFTPSRNLREIKKNRQKAQKLARRKQRGK